MEDKNCIICDMKDKKSHIKCDLCGTGIHGRPHMLKEDDKRLMFCCGACVQHHIGTSERYEPARAEADTTDMTIVRNNYG